MANTKACFFLAGVALLCVTAIVLGVIFGLGKDKLTGAVTSAPRPILPTAAPTDSSKKSAYGAYRYGSVASDTKICSQIGT